MLRFFALLCFSLNALPVFACQEIGLPFDTENNAEWAVQVATEQLKEYPTSQAFINFTSDYIAVEIFSAPFSVRNCDPDLVIPIAEIAQAKNWLFWSLSTEVISPTYIQISMSDFCDGPTCPQWRNTFHIQKTAVDATRVPTVTEQTWWFNFPSIGSYQAQYSLENGSGSLEERMQTAPRLEPGSNSLKISHGFKPYQLRDDIGIQVQRSLYFHALLEAFNGQTQIQ